MADFDSQPGRAAPPEPTVSSIQREADEADLHAGLRGVAGIVARAQGVIDLSSPAFANGALAEGFILSGRDMSSEDLPAFLRGTVANTFRTVAGFMNLQVTGGSSAIRFTGVYAMRVAGAAAREMLVKAAAARWNVDPASCSTKAGRVLQLSVRLQRVRLVRAVQNARGQIDVLARDGVGHFVVTISLPWRQAGVAARA